MRNKGRTVHSARSRSAARLWNLGAWGCGLVLFAIMTLCVTVRAEGPDQRYLDVYQVIDQADELSNAGKAEPAKARYREAYAGLLKLKEDYPTWNAKVVSYRLNYVAGKISALSRPVPTAGEDRASAGQTQAASSKAAGLPAGMQAKLLDAGAEPRQVLRFQVKPGDKQTTELSLVMSMETGMGAAAVQTVKLPAFQLTMGLTVTSVSPEGDAAYELVLEDIQVADGGGAAPQMAEMMKQAFAGVKGITTKGTTSSRGYSKGAQADISADANPQSRQSLEQMKDVMSGMALGLPEEAVGPGAKWEVKQVIKQQGMAINQTTTRELLSLEGDLLKVKSTITQQAANQKVQNPAIPGLKVDLTKMTGEGTSEGTFDLTRLLPVQATSKMHTEMNMGMDIGGQKQNITTKTDQDVDLESK